MRTETLLVLSALVRLFLVFFGEVQDRYGPVPYTDIDYEVFTDAARFVAQGQSPYLRSTYRYSPLLAYLLLPNIWISPLWGKLLFSAADIWVGQLITKLVRHLGASPSAATIAAAAWLYNPYTLTISTRGSCDVLVVALLLHTLWSLVQGHASRSAVWFGLAVHMRIYPIIYAPSLVLFLAARSQYKSAKRRAALRGAPAPPAPLGLPWPATRAHLEDTGLHVALHGMIFGFLSGGTFLLLGWAFLRLYGQSFLEEAFLHHIGRKDPRHNFSIYFYTIYLTYFNPYASTTNAAETVLTGAATDSQLDPLSHALSQLGPFLNRLAEPATLAFLPQLVLLVAVSCKLHHELPLCWLALTMVFVSLNKVCTAQYFVWWLSLLPLLLHHVTRPVPRGLWAAAVLWVVAQLHWLAWAYLLEFKGLPVHLPLWAASLVFLAANVFLLTQLLVCVKPASSFLARSLNASDSSAARRQDQATGPDLPAQPEAEIGQGIDLRSRHEQQGRLVQKIRSGQKVEPGGGFAAAGGVEGWTGAVRQRHKAAATAAEPS